MCDGVDSTGKPAAYNFCRRYWTFFWCFVLSNRPSAEASTPTAARAPAKTMGGNDVVNIKPAA